MEKREGWEPAEMDTWMKLNIYSEIICIFFQISWNVGSNYFSNALKAKIETLTQIVNK